MIIKKFIGRILFLMIANIVVSNQFSNAYKNVNVPNTANFNRAEESKKDTPAPIYIHPNDLYVSIESIRNKPQFKKWFKSAQAGNTTAQYELGRLFYEGTSLNDQNIAAQKEALKWYRMSAARGNKYAQNMLGQMIWNGNAGLNPDKSEAEKWIRKAALQGLLDAENSLGFMYDGHNYSDESVNYKEAYKWYKLAADQGNYDSMEPLAYLYRDGTGVKKDLIEAYKWIYLANHDVVMPGRFAGAPQETIKEFEQGMTKAQIAEGKRRATNWRPLTRK